MTITRFQLPSARNYFCEMKKTDTGYSLVIFHESEKLVTLSLTNQDINREILRKYAVNSGIEFYALSGPYDAADEILRQWHRHFKEKSILKRIFGK